MSDLLPCPNVTTEIRHPASGVQVRFRNGDNLGAEPLSDWIPAAELLAAWNRRSPPSVPPSVTVEEDACRDAYCIAAQKLGDWRTRSMMSEVEKAGVAAVMALVLSRTEKARERTTEAQ